MTSNQQKLLATAQRTVKAWRRFKTSSVTASANPFYNDLTNAVLDLDAAVGAVLVDQEDAKKAPAPVVGQTVGDVTQTALRYLEPYIKQAIEDACRATKYESLAKRRAAVDRLKQMADELAGG